jgi:hypothetical protein
MTAPSKIIAGKLAVCHDEIIMYGLSFHLRWIIYFIEENICGFLKECNALRALVRLIAK